MGRGTKNTRKGRAARARAAAAEDAARVRHVPREPKLEPVAWQTLAHPIFLHRFRWSDRHRSLPGQRESSRLLSSSLLPPSPTRVQYLQMEAAKEEKSSFARPARPAVAVGEKHIPLVRPPKPFRAADGRAMMGSVGPLELIARGGFSPE